jgi:hypothetical protein
VLLATELFDVEDEPTSGGTRTTYRINSRYALRMSGDDVADDRSPPAASHNEP